MSAYLQTSIRFYGVVLDQNATPVEGALIEATLLNDVTSGTPVTTTSGTDGRFVIDAKGASLHVHVSKEGFGGFESGGKYKPSSQGFDFASDTGRGVHVPNPDAPVVFNLRKPGKPVILEKIYVQAQLPQNGDRVAIPFREKRPAGVWLSCKSEAHPDGSVEPFDWRCEMKVEGGGIQFSDDEYAYEAPSEGYSPSVVIDMPKSRGKDWRDGEIKSYWLKLSDNTFARVKLRMVAGGEHFAVVEGHWNSTPHHRNLEPLQVSQRLRQR